VKKEKLSTVVSTETSPTTTGDVDLHWQSVVRRRSFLKGLGIAGAGLSAGALLTTEGKAQTSSRRDRLSPGDVAILRLLAAAELIESDLWAQYNELGGATGGNPAYILALQNLDGDMPQYITDNTDDELSHAAFLNAYLLSKGEQRVNLEKFRTLLPTAATGADQGKKHLTNLQNLNVDLSWYTRYRSSQNPDLGATFKGPFTITHEPAVPLNDTETPPNQSQPVPPATLTPQQARMQAIANTAGFHFAFIEQGGASLYATMTQKVTDLEVLRIVVSIGGVEVDHFGLWHDKAGNAVSGALAGLVDPMTGLTFPDLNAVPPAQLELTQTNKILPEPCSFIRKDLPLCSVIRPSSTQLGGAVATIQSFIDDNLFQGQPNQFNDLLLNMARKADDAERLG
jgi:hypothetical protein